MRSQKVLSIMVKFSLQNSVDEVLNLHRLSNDGIFLVNYCICLVNYFVVLVHQKSGKSDKINLFSPTRSTYGKKLIEK